MEGPIEPKIEPDIETKRPPIAASEDPKLRDEALMELYHAYCWSEDFKTTISFISSDFMQICHPFPQFAGHGSMRMIALFREVMNGKTCVEAINLAIAERSKTTKYFYTVRPLDPREHEFGREPSVVLPAGFEHTGELRRKAIEEGWRGLRVDTWFHDTASSLRSNLSMRMRYWWRLERGRPKIIMRQYLYIGRRDGNEGTEGNGYLFETERFH
ncbi:monocarboxylate permease-like protein [Paramyrothecium foliicola]|nr:monocarboxylate permease-like protein [Paramyrothecium foliicola]